MTSTRRTGGVAKAWAAGATLALAAASGVVAQAPPAAPPAPAAAASAPAADSSTRLGDERAAANARYLSREQECRTRFIVASCIDEAKRERRQELDRLRARQLVVDEARRRERAEARRTELAAKAAEDAKRSAQAASAASGAGSQASRGRLVPPGRPREPLASASGVASPPASGVAAVRSVTPGQGLGLGSKPPSTVAEREAEEARSRAAFEARQRRAAEHREDAATQAVRRMSSKAPAAPLPAPSSASAAKR